MASSDPSQAGSIPRRHAQAYFGDELTVWVDPAQLSMRLRNGVTDGQRSFLLSDRFIDAGNWSGIVEREEGLPEHREMIQLTTRRDGFSEMPAFADLVGSARRDRPQRRNDRALGSEGDVRTYFRHYLTLIESIERDGFQDRRALGRYRLPGQADRARPHAHRRNIGVATGMDGTLFRFLGGRHRLAIAQALGVSAVPVSIRLVHADWLRAEMQRTDADPICALRAWVSSHQSPSVRD